MPRKPLDNIKNDINGIPFAKYFGVATAYILNSEGRVPGNDELFNKYTQMFLPGDK